MVIGLTGNVAAGKSTVAGYWRNWGIPILSADDLARDAVAPGSEGLRRVEELLGPEAVAEDGSMDRAAVRRLVFNDPEARKGLEAIIHPIVRRLRDEWTDRRYEEGTSVVVWEVPLLFETGMEDEVDAVVLVDAPEDERLDRIVETRGLTRDEGEAIMSAQVPASKKRKKADIVIDNVGTHQDLEQRAREALEFVEALEL